MRTSLLYIILFGIFFIGCNSKQYRVVEVDNPVYKPNTAFLSHEDMSSPKFQALKDKYQLDTVFQGETDEFKRILMLRHWIKQHIKIDLKNPNYSGKGYVQGILDAALDGEGFHCGHFARVQNGILNAYGYATRFIGCGPGVPREFDGHHGTNEVWLNSLQKWMYIDAKYEHHFEKDGIPLSALEIRDEYLKNEAKDIVMVKGLEKIPTDFDTEMKEKKVAFAQTLTWITWSGNGNIFTVWPDHKEIILWYEDDFFKNNIWMRDGKPHWAYNYPDIVIRESNRDVIEWTPNTITSGVIISGNKACIELTSDTSNLKEYQIKMEPSGTWEKVENKFELKLQAKKHEYSFRAVNVADVVGSEHKIIIEQF